MLKTGQTVDGLKFESVDQIVVEQINAIESKNFDKKILLDIYSNHKITKINMSITFKNIAL